ncbi:MAG: SPW repeat protein [Jiangellaceae bacterium]
MATPTPAMEHHPDITEMRERYEKVAETPTAQSVDGLTFLAGLYLAMSPWVVGFTGHSAMTVTNLFSGIALALLALGFASVYGRTHGIAWVAPIIGAWVIVSPWLVAGPTPDTSAIVSNIIVGVVVILCTLGMMSAGRMSTGTRRRTA